METRIADLLSLEKATRERGFRVVAIGGGTGLSTLLKGLKVFALTPAEMAAARRRHPSFATSAPWSPSATTAVPAVACAKNSTCLPPGDIRNCIVALCEDEALLSSCSGIVSIKVQA